jgi:tetratricopeptide (TPR) repeat protein
MKTRVILSAALLVLLGAGVAWQILDEMEYRKKHEESLRKHKMLMSKVCKYAPSLETQPAELLTRLEALKEGLARTDEPERQEELREELRKSKARLDDLAGGFEQAGDACFEVGEFDKAIETIRMAISLDPENKQYQNQLEKFEQVKKVHR